MTLLLEPKMPCTLHQKWAFTKCTLEERAVFISTTSSWIFHTMFPETTPVLSSNEKPHAITEPWGTAPSDPWSLHRPLVEIHQCTCNCWRWTVMILAIQKSSVVSSSSRRTAIQRPGAKLKFLTVGAGLLCLRRTWVCSQVSELSWGVETLGWGDSPSNLLVSQTGSEWDRVALCCSNRLAHSPSSGAVNNGSWQLSRRSWMISMGKGEGLIL